MLDIAATTDKKFQNCKKAFRLKKIKNCNENSIEKFDQILQTFQ